MNWVDAAPIALVTIAWLLAPGLVVSYLIGLRGVAAWGVAPIISVAVIASTAVVAQWVGVGWSVPVVLVAGGGVALLTFAATFLARRTGLFAAGPDPRRLTLAAAAGLVPTLVLGTATVIRAMGRPDALSQVFDTPFHYNALAHIRDSQQASSLTMSALGNPDIPTGFYPAAWHDIGSLVMLTTGTSIPVASNMVAAVVAVVLWPLSCLLLVRQLFGRNLGALVAAAVLSIGFPAFPWDLMGFGVLWPNLLGLSMAPAALAVVVTLTGWARDDAIGRGRGRLLVPVVVVGAAFAHPNVLFSLVVLSVFFVGAALVRRAARLRGEDRTVRGVAEVAGFVVLLLLGWWWAATTPALAAARDWIWLPYETPAHAVGEALLNATNNREALWLLSALVVTGALAGRRYPVLRLVVAGHLAAAFLFVIAAGINRPDTHKFTGYWYNDSHRLAAMLPITGVPLAVGGVLLLATIIAGRIPAAGDGSRPAGRLRVPAAAASATAIAVGLTAAVVAGTGLLYPADRAGRVAVTYFPSKEYLLVSAEMRAFFDRIAERIPEDAVVAGNPFDGSVMLWALEDRRVLFPHLLGTHSAGQEYLAGHLDDAATDPEVCRLANDLGVGYLLIGKSEARTNEGYYGGIAGIAESGQAPPGFELMDSSGETRLYRITACDRTAPATASSTG